MDFFTELPKNHILIAAIAGWLVAQVLKTIIHMIYTKEFVAERLVGNGGMPSSHSATVCALATATFMEYGSGSFQFAIAVIFAIVVMHDASGVRRETGIQAKVLNDIIQVISDMSSDMSPHDKLKEFVGHTPLQVVVGAALGVIVALFLP
jgi:acid phosphatase family membrane protein YuiD